MKGSGSDGMGRRERPRPRGLPKGSGSRAPPCAVSFSAPFEVAVTRAKRPARHADVHTLPPLPAGPMPWSSPPFPVASPGRPRAVPPARGIPLFVRLPFGLLLFAILLAAPTLEAQHVGDLLVPRGAILLEAGGLFSQAAERFSGGGRIPLGAGAFEADLTADRFPVLEREQEALRALLADPEASLRAGAFQSRLELNDQRVPLRVGYGIVDRLTVGVTVPLVRRRVDAHLQVSGADANVGENPARGPTATDVAAFRSEAAGALASLRTSVEALCAAEGAETEACLAGRASEARFEGFLGLLNEAWDDLDLFPLTGSAAGSTLRSRWAATRAELEAWGVETPSTLPLAQRISPSTLQAGLSDPIWGSEGFPVTTPESFLVLGDVELHAVVGLVGIRSGASEAPGAPGLRVRSALEATLRLATGVMDSLAVVTPSEPVAGFGGVGLRWVTDVLLGRRAGVLVDVEWQGFGESTGRLLAFDAEDAWNPSHTRVTAAGTPGDRLRVGVTPRFILVPGLSLGGGFEVLRTGEARWTVTDSPPGFMDSAPLPAPHMERIIPAWNAQRAVVELRFSGWEDPVVGGLPFPVQLTFRGVRAVGGSDGAPVDTRLEMGARILRRR